MPFSSTIATGITEAAEALGVSPVDLATIISYETAGTFDPTKRGPTTRWGTHRGFIQFGEPQAKLHGVNWDDPIASQLGSNGAIVSYMRASGVKPGMSLLDLYSAVNAGSPGKYNASDSASGGAPGTVRDKVTTQMADHRKKAIALLSSSQSPAENSAAPDTNLFLSPPDTPIDVQIMNTNTASPPAPPSPPDSRSGYSALIDSYRRQLSQNIPGKRSRSNLASASTPVIFNEGT